MNPEHLAYVMPLQQALGSEPVALSTPALIVIVLITITLLFALFGPTKLWVRILSGPGPFQRLISWIMGFFSKKKDR